MTGLSLPADAPGVLTNDGTGGLSWAQRHRIVTVPTDGQTAFPLPTAPTDALSVEVEVNGVEAVPNVDFTLSGNTVTWSGAYALGPLDVVVVEYV